MLQLRSPPLFGHLAAQAAELDMEAQHIANRRVALASQGALRGSGPLRSSASASKGSPTTCWGRLSPVAWRCGGLSAAIRGLEHFGVEELAITAWAGAKMGSWT